MSKWQSTEDPKVWTVVADKKDDMLYTCDPKKHVLCAKTSCYMNGGECCHTLSKQYALYPEEENNGER